MKIDENKCTPQLGEGEYRLNAIVGRCSGTSACAPRQSISVESGSAGCPSRGSDAAIATPSRNNHMARVHHLDIHQEDLVSTEAAG
jgi:hypothetical protein